MAPKRSHTSGPSTSSAPPSFHPTYLFKPRASAGKFLQIKEFTVAKENANDVDNLTDYEELSNTLEKRGWMRLNSLIKETNQSIGVHFCVINKLWGLAAVHVHPDDVMVRLVLSSTASSIRQVLNTPHLVRDQEEKGDDDVYCHVMKPPERVHHHDRQPEQMQQWEKFSLGITTWHMKLRQTCTSTPLNFGNYVTIEKPYLWSINLICPTILSSNHAREERVDALQLGSSSKPTRSTKNLTHIRPYMREPPNCSI
ncbi:hypothetical protein RYX36_032670 [Vicia faba]